MYSWKRHIKPIYTKLKYRFCITVLFALLFNTASLAQCISAFPYNEGFETSQGNWTSGGTNNDWAWGTPSKPVITAAGSGLKCWITGGLSKSSYNNGELAWIKSPCFNFSILTNPYISFKVFWETERNYDGAVLQYSVDDGVNWFSVGTVNDNANCLNENWYNNASVRYLNSGEGWSGNIQQDNGSCTGGNGSGKWITAKHTMPYLSGETKVIFRFLFGAGTTCNSFDGFAVDDIMIGEAPPNHASFQFTCTSSNIVQFTSVADGCPSLYEWAFGDPASGINNFSNEVNPVHAYSLPGQYSVSLKVSGPDNFSFTYTSVVNILHVSVQVLQSNLCYGDTKGVAQATVTGGGSVFTYSWNTSPVQVSEIATGLSAGEYTVTVGAENACNDTAVIEINEPEKIAVHFQVKDALCANADGSIAASVTGGAMPYSYKWSIPAGDNNFIDGLATGVYHLTVTDVNNCAGDSSISVASYNPLTISLGKDTGICTGERIQLSPGDFETYTWQDNSSSNNFSVTQPGLYYVTVLDINGCIAKDTIKIFADCGDIFFPSAFSPNNDGLNDYFGPSGNLSLVSNYQFMIYNRWGKMIFQSTDPEKKWDGKINGQQPAIESYVFFAKFSYREQKNILLKGTITILR